MVHFGLGHNGPKSVLLQILLNTYPPQARLVVDGAFGRRTREALIAFQRNRPIAPTGTVDDATWNALAEVARMRVIDIVDIDDFLVAAMENPNATPQQIVATGHQYGVVAGGELARAGQHDIIANIGMSNGVVRVVQQVRGRASGGRIALLRIFGHGTRGYQILTAGHGVTGTAEGHGSALTPRTVAYFHDQLATLRPFFLPYGSAELHGCHVGEGPRGHALVRDLAEVWNIPVTAGIRLQQVGRGQTFSFEGPTVTAYPGGSLHAWARRAEAACAYSNG